MARPTKEDRSQVAESTLTVRLTEGLRATLDQLVEQRAAELADEGVEVTAASFIRWLILKEAKARGVAAAVPAAHTERPPRDQDRVVLRDGVAWIGPAPAPTRVEKAKKAPAPTLLARVEKVIKSGTSAASLARSAGIDPGQLSRFKSSGKGLSPETEAKLTAALDRM